MTLWPIFVASLLGSPHCAAMCGMIAGAAGRRGATTIGYHGARLFGYATLGALAGGAGAAADRLGAWTGVAGAAVRVSGVALIIAGVAGILASLGKGPRFAGAHRLISAVAARGRAFPPFRRAVLLGLVTAVLPCGWLFAFVAGSAGTGHPLRGALAMAVFWLGTVPAVASAGWLVARIAGPLRARLPALAGAVLIVLGLITAFGRLHQGHDPTSAAPAPAAHDHHAR